MLKYRVNYLLFKFTSIPSSALLSLSRSLSLSSSDEIKSSSSINRIKGKEDMKTIHFTQVFTETFRAKSLKNDLMKNFALVSIAFGSR